MKILSIDIETYSDIEITRGVYKYVDSPNFKILLFGYSIDGGPVEVIDLTSQPFPDVLLEMLENPNVLKTAFNAQFERVCINKYFGVNSKNWECTMIHAWKCGITGGLDGVATAIGISEEEGKIKDGKRLIKKFSIPSGKVKQTDLLDEKDWNLFIEYCKRDVEVELKIREKLPLLTEASRESRLYALDQKINDNGFRLDIDFINNAIKIDDDIATHSIDRFRELTGKDNPNSLKDIKDFIFDKTNIEVKSLAKGEIENLKYQFRGFPDILEVIEIREILSKTSTAKYRTMLDVAMEDKRSRGNFQFYGASTSGRWAGRLIQPQNLPRNYIKDLDIARKAILTGDYELVEMLYGDVTDVLSQCIRTAIIPEEGKRFLVADFSAIEARIIAWFANEDWVVDVFRGHGKIYEATASKMFNIPLESITKGSNLRDRGKVATLALGYQGGVGALKQMGALKMGILESELQDIVDKWRTSNSNIVQFWYDTGKAVEDAISNKGEYQTWADGRLTAFYSKSILWIRLPSGRHLAYAKPALRPHQKGWERNEIVFQERTSGNKWRTSSTYGGKLVENIVQATARDVLAESLLKLDEKGYKIVMHIHDEVVIEIDENKDELQTVCGIMGQSIDWANGLPLRADGYMCDYYQKD